MSDVKVITEAVQKAIKDSPEIKDLKTEVADLKKKATTPVYPNGVRPGQLFHATSGPIGNDSQPYSLLKMIAVTQKWKGPEYAKNEVAISDKLKSMYNAGGWSNQCHHPQSFLVPHALACLPTPETSEQEAIINETKAMVLASKYQQTQVDPNEAEWISQKTGGAYNAMFAYLQKAIGSIADSAGGVLLGFPTLGELIELQRKLEVFPNCGASEIALGPNGRIQFPKQTGGCTAYWVGEASTITASDMATGYLDLIAKKAGVLCKINNELLRFTSPTTEALIRTDMSLQSALLVDLAMLEGTGGTQIKGLITYDTQSAWAQGTDKLITYTVTANLFQPNDPADMEAVMADMAGAPTAWIMRRNMFAKIRNRRAASVTTGDGAGPFVFNITREARQGIPLELEGVKVVRSSQVSNTRGSGAQTYVILGYFPDWLIGRVGVMEFLPSGVGDTPLQNDQTWLRGIQHIDAGARHAASFVLADAITIS